MQPFEQIEPRLQAINNPASTLALIVGRFQLALALAQRGL